MKCPDCQNLLQRRLDGEVVAMTPEWKAHLQHCLDCRQEFAAAQLLKKGLDRRTTLTMPSSTLTSKIVNRVAEDRKRRQYRAKVRWYAIWAMAASVLLVVGIVNFGPKKDPGTKTKEWVKEPRAIPFLEEQPALARSMEEATQAVASLTGRFTEKTKENAQILWNIAQPMDLAKVHPLSAVQEWDDTFDPAAQSLQKAGEAVGRGFEPVARTARQAFDFFTREAGAFRTSFHELIGFVGPVSSRPHKKYLLWESPHPCSPS